jgi:hypothetical protein
MSHYLVRWEIDVYADTPEQAAQEALAIQRDAESTATVFEVLDVTASGPGVRVEVTEQEPADEDDDQYPPRCTHPGGHKWNRSAGEADEARLSGDYANDNIRCIYCGADGDA